MSNRELIQLINEYQRGNMKNFDLLYEVFKRLIYMYAGKKGGEETVQDLNDFFVELLFKIDLSRFQKDYSDSLKRYIAVSIRNEHNLICKKHQEHLPLNEELIGTLSENSLSAEDRLFLKDCLDAVTESQRTVLILRYIEGYSDAEIAALLHISRQAICRLRSRAIETIRKKFKI